MDKLRLHLLGLTIIATALLSGHIALSAELRVIATIKPIHSLAASVMAGVGEPELLIKGANSPHNFALKPSDARNLSKADVIFWVGGEIETFLIKPLKTLAATAQVHELSKAPGLKLLAARQDGEWDSHDEDHDHEGNDPHFWLDPDNARIIVEEIVRKLSSKDTKNANRYASNGAALITELNSLTSELMTKLAPVKTAPFIVFHDAFQYFEKRFDLKSIGAVTLSPERTLGAKKIRRIRAKIISENVVCIFAEPQFKPAIIKTIIHNTSVKMAILDPLGVDIPAGPAAYVTHLRSMTDTLVSCLGAQK